MPADYKPIIIDTAEVMEPERTIKYTVVRDGFPNVCVECSFSDGSQHSCVVIIHEVLSCPDLSFPCDAFIMNIEASHKLNRSGERAYGCIQTINLTFYEVGVIGGELVSTLSVPGTYTVSPPTPPHPPENKPPLLFGYQVLAFISPL